MSSITADPIATGMRTVAWPVAARPVAAADVEVLHWPGPLTQRLECADRGMPCLLVIHDGPPPSQLGPLEDWIRVPADELDVVARMRRLSSLASSGVVPPVVDEENILHVGNQWTALSPGEASVARCLSAQFGRLVGRRDLLAALIPAGERRSRTLDLQICRLRRRIAALGLVVTSVRGRGYVMDAAQTPRVPSGARPT